MRVRVLASGSRGNAYVLEDGGHTLLLEAGIAFPRLRKALDFKVSQLDACLITHEHGDHARSALQVSAAGVTIYGSAGTKAELMVPAYRFQQMRPGKAYTIAHHWRVLGFDAVHDAREPFGFLIEGRTGKLLYVTDTAYCPYTFNGLTHVLVEANYSDELLDAGVMSGAYPEAHARRVRRNHMSITRAVDLLQANDLSRVERIILLHLSDANGDAEAFKTAAMRATGLPVDIAPEREEAWTTH